MDVDQTAHDCSRTQRLSFLGHERIDDPEAALPSIAPHTEHANGYTTPTSSSESTLPTSFDRDRLSFDGVGDGDTSKRHLLELEEEEEEVGVEGESRVGQELKVFTRRDKIINAIIIVLNTLSAVGVVLLNKSVFMYPQFQHAPVLFTISHFACTSIVLWIASHKPFSLFEPISIPILKVLPLSVAFCAWVILNNLSLLFNPVSFYQLAKIMTVPCVVVLNFLVFKTTVDLRTALALVSVCFGVALTNTGEGAIKTTVVGSAVAIAAFVATAVYQIWIQKKHRELRVSSPQLLMCQAPLGAALLCFAVPFSDTIPDPRTVSMAGWWTLLASALMASVLNLTGFMVIGRTGTITYNVVSNLKTVIILTLGWIIDARGFTGRDLVGVIFAVGGAFIYSQVQSRG